MPILPTIDPNFKNLIPPLGQEESEQLEQNILESRKCYDPIILWEGVIIDGHNRFEICMKNGIEFQVEEISLSSREEAKVWILENQLSRRNLTDAARIEMALLKAELLQEKARKNQAQGRPKKDGEKPLSEAFEPHDEKLLSLSSKPDLEAVHIQKTTAAEAGVSEGKLYYYTQIKEHGSPELLAKVQSGELKIGTAYRLLAKEILKQLNIGDKMIKFIQASMPPEGYKAADPEIHEKLAHLSSMLEQLMDKLAKGGRNDAA